MSKNNKERSKEFIEMAKEYARKNKALMDELAKV